MRAVRCTFYLNDQRTSWLHCSGAGPMAAFSGQKDGRDNPAYVDREDVGPLPKGTYYIVDRKSGGRLGFLYDLWGEYGLGTTDHKKWFMLWNPKTGDSTMINGIKRGNFRLHPMGSRRLSEGCITVVDPSDFDRLSRYLRSHAPDLPVPGATLKAYGTVEVR
ncbi:DUF2778 domain-containing protein [Paraburkholderia sp. GAS82]|jgi:hypothetical protein|uniref:DUF2778 domain-containing protein n=1 Tax=Paraburkholderia sp. GAS82 TaxID=3035137 RepID=UPI003D1F965F